MKEMSNKEKIKEILTRGVGEFIDPNDSFKRKLEESPEKIVIKHGVDPTKPDIHLGHAVSLRKLRAFQDLGCKVVFLIGDYTARIGDPTGKSRVRPELEQKEIEANMQTYLDQVGKILNLDLKVFTWTRNSDWFTAINDLVAPEGAMIKTSISGKEVENIPANSTVGKAVMYENSRMQKSSLLAITLRSFLWTLRSITHGKLVQRDMFQDRINSGTELYMHEMMYPVLQGVDSFAISHIYGSCDLEVGGTDQHFNMLMGRDVMQMNDKDPQAVLSFKLLEGTDGKEKMSKSLDNYIGITDEPDNMYGKVMSIPDALLSNYFELCTFTSLEDIENIKEGLKSGELNPKETKMELAGQIVSMYHGQEKAESAREAFVETFQKGGVPENVPEVESAGNLLETIVKSGVVDSKKKARRLVEEGAVKNMSSGEKIKIGDPEEKGIVYKIGKHKFIKII